ncbi:uncharacterized protein SPPG_00390 [Spizellomyces punctatus DAOM BR117]|uniref:GMP phosphodiesterase delta subunit domain-containing protein n=1 Tax=Spizellomyces punctatus (strain DAOM BR117) TaxID=645134 RepID=A0A0L0HUV7_SPIPD|nr:uncharacterized protein SPPG_00390 [Spizellomyces punctatus DAOM BR117]KND04675.1 hypothetical protein SPPG_00390 [Spizellomyces punctatus DAOM BR117]|eukprot:XP_016612714.1 hypothetical protein SPPG_00390 [Spizellomyces punctatus DAOM BR117]
MANKSKSTRPQNVTPEMVLKYTKPTDKFLCPLSLNKYIEFLEFRIRDMESSKVVFEVKRPSVEINWKERDLSGGDELRTIAYTFPVDFLSYKTVGTTLVFAVCPEGIQNFRMIERHYFKGKLLKSFDFTFGYCIPNSVNTWEAVYSLPELTEKQVQEMVDNPGSTLSDSFYFVDDRLIMHNKASYSYS